MPSNPHLNENFYDPITDEHFCAHCEALLERHGEIIKDHIVGVWKHFGTLRYPGIKAKDILGRTIEHEWAIPPRVTKGFIPIQNSLRFCQECFPFIITDVCGGCSKAIEEEHDVTRAEILWKYVNGHNTFQMMQIHLDCLTEHFDELKKYYNEKKG